MTLFGMPTQAARRNVIKAICLLLPLTAHGGGEQYLSFIAFGDKTPRFIRSFKPVRIHPNEKECIDNARELAALLNAEPSMQQSTSEPNCRKIEIYKYGDVLGMLKFFPMSSASGQGAILLDIRAYESMELCEVNQRHYAQRIINNSLSYKYLDCYSM